MTDQKINTALAESLPSVARFSNVDYCHDLNIMHQLESGLSNRECETFEKLLFDLVQEEHLKWISGHKDSIKVATMRTWHATAQQRAEAFLRVKKLWKD